MKNDTDTESPICETEERDAANLCLQELIETFNKYNLRTQDLVVVYGNLGYALGASVDGIDEGQGPTMEELKKSYYANPTIGTSLMLQGFLVTSWYDQVNKGNVENKSREEKQDDQTT